MERAPPRARPRLAVELALFLAIAAFAGVFTHLHMKLNRVHPPAALDRLCAYTAEMPYQNRVLVPTIVRAIEVSGLGVSLGVTQLESALWIEAACVVALFYVLRVLLGKFVAGPWQPTIWAAVGMYALTFHYVLPSVWLDWYLWPYWYPWDLPAVLFTTLGVLWIREARWSWYYWVFPFATLNRETTSFLIVIFALTQFGKLKWFSLAQHLAAQVAIWLGIKWLLNQTFQRKAGDVGEYYADALKDNWAALHELSTWATLPLVFGFLWLPLCFFARHVREPFVRRALLVVPLFFALSFALAQFDELRIYGEMVPIVILGLACGVSDWRVQRISAPERAIAAAGPPPRR